MTLHVTDCEVPARIAHEVNRAWCAFNGDHSQPTWELAPQWQKDSAIAGVQFHHNNPYATEESSHNSWLKQKLADGWRYGEVKDAEAKTHPCICHFGQLPREQQFKDALFRAVCRAYLDG